MTDFRSITETSVPFLRFAVHQDVPYSEVLRFADAVEARGPVASAILTREQCLLIGGLVAAENDRRAVVRFESRETL